MAMRRSCMILASLIMVGGCAATQPASVPPTPAGAGGLPEITFEGAWALASANSETPEGKRWETTRELEHALGVAFAACRLVGTSPETMPRRDFRLALQLAADGRIVRGLIQPASPRNDCIRTQFQLARLSAPPWDGYWIGVAIHPAH